MTRFLLDTSFCIACLTGKPWARAALRSVAPSAVAVSAVTVGELMLAAHLAEDPERELARVETFLRPVEVIPLGREEAERWAKVKVSLRKKRKGSGVEFGMLASTAMVHEMTLVSGRAKHLCEVKGLKVVDWERHFP